MSEKKHPENPFLDQNLNPKNEGSENAETKQVEENILSTDIENANLSSTLDPKNEGSENAETKQVEQNVLSTDIENANLYSTLDSLRSDNPTFDIALSQLSLEVKGNQNAIPKSVADQIAALESTSDQMADLEVAAERMTIYESAADQKAASGSASDQKSDPESAPYQIVASGSMIQFAASESPVPDSAYETSVPDSAYETSVPDSAYETSVPDSGSETSVPDSGSETSVPDSVSETSAPGSASEVSAPGSASEVSAPGSASEVSAPGSGSEVSVISFASLDAASLELPPTPRLSLTYSLIMQQFPALLDEGNMLRDIYGVTSIRDEILLDVQNRLLFIIYEHRRNNRSTNLAVLLSHSLITELKRLYSQGLIENLILEGDISNYSELNPSPEEHGKMMCAALVFGFTLLAFANYTHDDRERRLKEIAERCRVSGVPLPHEPQNNPMHPWTRWLQCISVSYAEIQQYLQALQDAISYFSKRNEASINKELGG